MQDRPSADEALLAAVIRESRRIRALRLLASLLPGVALALLGLLLGPVWALLGAAVVVALGGLAWQARILGPLPRGRLSLFDGTHPLSHITFSGLWVYTTCDGRRTRLFGEAAASSEFRQVLRRRWPELPQFVSVLPPAG